MSVKNNTCHYCGASFVPTYKGQQYCEDCLMNRRDIEDRIMQRKFKDVQENNEKRIL